LETPPQIATTGAACRKRLTNTLVLLNKRAKFIVRVNVQAAKAARPLPQRNADVSRLQPGQISRVRHHVHSQFLPFTDGPLCPGFAVQKQNVMAQQVAQFVNIHNPSALFAACFSGSNHAAG
jgi:hypothetical protein